ncbi:hypothetical protein LIA77_05157 [Sarocladium implicatum]|nr:hypothetical protein LIA77_05157 [Sarocladium implicatum]
MSESFVSALCDKEWAMDPDNARTMRFFQDGTGEFVIRVAFHLLIACKFTYTISSPTITITLSPTRLAAINEQQLDPRLPLNDDFLLPQAFEPKTYDIQIDEGKYPVSYGERGEHGLIMQWCRLRLLFDRNPVPPIDEWKERHKVENYKIWDKNDFYADVIPKEQVSAA